MTDSRSNKVAFIGAGNMNSAIILGLLNSGVAPTNIIVSNPSPEKRVALTEQYGIANTADNIAAAEFADTIVLGVKPHLIASVCQQLAEKLNLTGKCFISVAAGTTVAQIQQALGANLPVIRTMPNTPSQLGLGVSGIYPSNEVTEGQKATADNLMKAVGIVKWLKTEEEIDHIIAVSGSGPAYFFLFMEAMEQQAKALGFTEQESRELVQQTALGAAKMVIENQIPIKQLRDNVTSKGGTTQAALSSFIDDGLPQLVTNAMNAALHRAKEMAQNNT
jgi:pyrroline-5-carboxylate reductase